MQKRMDHNAYQAKVRDMTDEQLQFVIDDCRAVIASQAEFNPNVCYYQDEMHYCAMEVMRRRRLARQERSMAAQD